MNSIEYIDKLIKLEKENLDYHKKLLKDNPDYAKEINSTIKLLEKDYNTLQQIKTELEAWEVVKEKFFIDIIERDNDYKIGFEPKTPIINGKVTRFAQLDNYKGTIIKKALEVKDNA